MKLIIEKDGDGLFAYRESEKQFKTVDKDRQSRLTRVNVKTLDEECDLDQMENRTYIVVDIK